MKRIFAYTLITVILLGVFSSCGDSNTANDYNEAQTIQTTEKIPTSKDLKEDNFDEHFAVKIDVTNYHEIVKSKIFYDCSCYLTVEIEKKSDIEIVENIPIKLYVFTGKWSISEAVGPAYQVDGSYCSTIEIQVPKSGYFYQTFKCTYFGAGSKAGDLPNARIGSVNSPPVIHVPPISFS